MQNTTKIISFNNKVYNTYLQYIADTSLDSPAGIAFDWIGRNLYWTDSGNNRIEVSNIVTKQRTVLLWKKLDHPRDIVVHPKKG